MILLNVQTYQLVKPGPVSAWPPYATVSHCREDANVTINHLHDVDTQGLKIASHAADLPWIIRSCLEVREFGVDLLWVDTLCIDRSSSTEHSAAINSMFQIFQGSQVCLVHLGDIEAPKDSLEGIGEQIQHSRWANRAWMLQELIASEDLQFFDNNWNPMGTKMSLLPVLSRLLSIDEAVLKNSKSLLDFPVGRRMSWASRLSAIRNEDLAYSLLGIFGVQLTVIYGEGGTAAFIRLQEEILKVTDDLTLFAWKSADNQEYRGIFAHFASEYDHFGVHSRRMPVVIRGHIQKSPAGILICDAIVLRSTRSEIALYVLGQSNVEKDGLIFGIPLLKWNNLYVRTSPSMLLNLDKLPKGEPGRICITYDVSLTASSMIAMQIAFQFKFPSNTVEIETGTSGKERYAANNALCQEQSSPIHKSSVTCCPEQSSPIRNSNLLATSNHATYIFKPEDRPDRIAVSAVGSTSTLFLGSMVPFNESGSLQVGNQPSQAGIAAEPSPQTWHQVLERRPRKRTRDMSYASDISDSGEEVTDSSSDSFELTPVLDDDDPLLCLVEELADSSLARFSQSVRSRTYEQTSHTLSAANKRQKFSGDFKSTHTRCDTHSVGTASTRTSGPEVRSFPFTCPFHIRTPHRYQGCVKQGGFSGFRDLCRHLSSCHRLPYFCPVCGEIFPRASIRDHHIRKMTCNLGPETNFEGVSGGQIAQLLEQSKFLESREAQWVETWNNVFLEGEYSSVPYFASNIELYIRSLREYWTGNGQGVINEFLESKEAQGKKIHANAQEKLALGRVVLDRMVDGLIKLLMPTDGGLQDGKSFQQAMEEARGG